MAAHTLIGTVSEIPAEGVLPTQAEGVDLIIVTDAEKQIKVYQGRCPHRNTLLSEGEVKNHQITCPLHSWKFELREGKRIDGGKTSVPHCLKSFAAKEDEAGNISISSEELAQFRKESEAQSEKGTRHFSELSGPKGWPLLGVLPKVSVNQLHNHLEKWSDQYGDFYKLQLGPKEMLVVADPEAKMEILKKRPDQFRRSQKMDVIIQESGLTGVFNAEGEQWKKLRKITAKALDMQHLNAFYPSLEEVSFRLLGRWKKAAEQKMSFPVLADLMRFTVDVTTRLAFGYEMNTLEKGEDVIQQHLEKVFPTLFQRVNFPVPYWRYFQLPSDKKFLKSLEAIKATIGQFIEVAEQQMAENPELQKQPENFLQAMIAASKEEGALTNAELLGNVFTILMAGEDTTANSLGWMIWYLGQHPEVFQKIKSEMDEALGENRVLSSAEQASKLSYTEAVAMETMRLKPVAPILLMMPLKEMTLKGIRLPELTPIILLNRAAGLKDEYFSQAAQFNPDRWLSPEAQTNHFHDASTPFGAGPRYCPGRQLAMLEIKAVMAVLARNFEMEVLGIETVKENLAFTLMPTEFEVRLS